MKGLKFLSGSALKLIALVCMAVDHVSKLGAHAWPWMKEVLFTVGHTRVTPLFLGSSVVGRMAFPLFAFLLVEGFRHSRHLGRYMGSLLLFALVSQVPFNLMAGRPWYDWHHLNVMFTLLLGLCALVSLRRSREWKAAGSEAGSVSAVPGVKVVSGLKAASSETGSAAGSEAGSVSAVPGMKAVSGLKAAFGVLVPLALAFFLHCDYSAYGVALIVLLYVLQKPEYQSLALLAVFGRSKFTICAALASVPMLLYNGQRGFVRGRVWKYAFYAFYPR